MLLEINADFVLQALLNQPAMAAQPRSVRERARVRSRIIWVFLTTREIMKATINI
jgi:hypothetical protein